MSYRNTGSNRVANRSGFPRTEGFPGKWMFDATTRTVPGKLVIINPKRQTAGQGPGVAPRACPMHCLVLVVCGRASPTLPGP